jgi:hypothetical protein
LAGKLATDTKSQSSSAPESDAGGWTHGTTP